MIGIIKMRAAKTVIYGNRRQTRYSRTTLRVLAFRDDETPSPLKTRGSTKAVVRDVKHTELRT